MSDPLAVAVVNGHFPHLPASFWQQSEQLTRIQQAAHARQVAPEAVLAVVLCRVAAATPPGRRLPNDGTLDFVAALVGESGTGKSVARGAARKLLPNIGTTADDWPIGSGEGIAQAYVGKPDDNGDQPIVNSSVLFWVDEGQQLLNVARRDGSTTMATIRSAWSGQTIGNTNATPDRRRIVPGGSYRFAMAVGFQPPFAAELLDGVAAGDPQRFLWVGVTHPDQPDVLPPFPRPLDLPLAGLDVVDDLRVDPEVQRGLIARRNQRVRREVPVDPLDSHRDLLTMKVGGLLATLHGDDVTVAWWNAATDVVTVSQGVRRHLAEVRETERLRKRDSRNADVISQDDAREANRYRRAMELMVRTVGNYARNQGQPVTRTQLQQATASKHRQDCPFDDALNEAVRQGVLVRHVLNGKSAGFLAGRN